jgi:transposase
MARPYSNDLRERVAASVELGRTCRETAELFGVSVSSVVKWSQRQRSTGTAAALPMGGNRGRSLEAHRDWLLERIAAPGMTVRLLAVELRDRGIVASPVSIWRVLKEAGFSFKKNAVRKRAGSARRHAQAPAMEEVSRPSRSAPPSLHR